MSHIDRRIEKPGRHARLPPGSLPLCMRDQNGDTQSVSLFLRIIYGAKQSKAKQSKARSRNKRISEIDVVLLLPLCPSAAPLLLLLLIFTLVTDAAEEEQS